MLPLMTIADKITLSRMIMAPFFFFFVRAEFIPRQPAIIILWILFAWMEISDLIDGKVARRSNQVGSFGKLFDPFADVISRVTYFLAFASIGIMPLWVLLIVMYREFGILFLRALLALKGTAMGARPGGKLKAGTYMVAGLLSLCLYTVQTYASSMNSAIIDGFSNHSDKMTEIASVLHSLTSISYVVVALATILSFIDYMIQFKKIYGQTNEKV